MVSFCYRKIFPFCVGQIKEIYFLYFSSLNGRGDKTRTCVYPLGRSASSIKLNINKKTTIQIVVIRDVVGATRLELATSASQTPRATNCATPRNTTLLIYHISINYAINMLKL